MIKDQILKKKNNSEDSLSKFNLNDSDVNRSTKPDNLSSKTLKMMLSRLDPNSEEYKEVSAQYEKSLRSPDIQSIKSRTQRNQAAWNEVRAKSAFIEKGEDVILKRLQDRVRSRFSVDNLDNNVRKKRALDIIKSRQIKQPESNAISSNLETIKPIENVVDHTNQINVVNSNTLEKDTSSSKNLVKPPSQNKSEVKLSPKMRELLNNLQSEERTEQEIKQLQPSIVEQVSKLKEHKISLVDFNIEDHDNLEISEIDNQVFIKINNPETENDHDDNYSESNNIQNNDYDSKSLEFRDINVIREKHDEFTGKSVLSLKKIQGKVNQDKILNQIDNPNYNNTNDVSSPRKSIEDSSDNQNYNADINSANFYEKIIFNPNKNLKSPINKPKIESTNINYAEAKTVAVDVADANNNHKLKETLQEDLNKQKLEIDILKVQNTDYKHKYDKTKRPTMKSEDAYYLKLNSYLEDINNEFKTRNNKSMSKEIKGFNLAINLAKIPLTQNKELDAEIISNRKIALSSLKKHVSLIKKRECLEMKLYKIINSCNMNKVGDKEQFIKSRSEFKAILKLQDLIHESRTLLIEIIRKQAFILHKAKSFLQKQEPNNNIIGKNNKFIL